MVLEYLEDRTLREWMAQRERPPAAGLPDLAGLVSPSLAVELVLPVVRALACAHALGVVHRDLEPENVFLTSAGRVVVLGIPYVVSHGHAVLDAAWSPDGTKIVTRVGEDSTAWIWAVRAPFQGTDDPRLWAATPYCLSDERRIALL